MLSSSFLTQRLRDKAIAQQVQKSNKAGKPIIIPQAGYGSYTTPDVDNGAINAYNKVQGCTTVDIACQCAAPLAPVIPDTPSMIIYNNVPGGGQVTVSFKIIGSGSIDWGDGTTSSFNNSPILTLNNSYGLESHTYTLPIVYYKKLTPKIITIYGNIIEFKGTLTQDEINSPVQVQAPYPNLFPDSITFLNIPNLISFICESTRIKTLNNLELATNLLTFMISGSSLDLSQNVSPFSTLTQLQVIGLNNIKAIPVNQFLEFTNVFPNARSISIYNVADNIPVGIDVINPTLEVLKMIGLNINISNIPALGSLTTLKELDLSFNTSLLTVPDPLPPNLEILRLKNNSGINSLPILPSSLLELNIESTTISFVDYTQIPNLEILIINYLSTDIFPINPLNNLLNFEAQQCSGNTISIPDFSIITPNLLYLNLSGTNGFVSAGPINLPPTLITLNISSCYQINDIPTIPLTLTYLDIRSTNITSLPSLPITLEELYLSYSLLSSLPILSSTSLKILYMDHLNAISGIPTPLLPNSIIELNIGATDWSGITNWPTSVNIIYIQNYNYSSLQDLSASIPSLTLLPSLKELYLDASTYTSLPDIPLSLTALYFGNTNITSIPSSYINSNLTTISISNNSVITDISNIPNTLTILQAGNCTSLTTLPSSWPPNLNTIELDGCSSLSNSSLPTSWPSTLGVLVLANTTLNNIPSIANISIQFLNLSNIPNLILPILPETLFDLNIESTGISSLPSQLPLGLEGLNIQNNPNLSSIPPLPNLEYLNANNCSILSSLPTLPSTITNILISYCNFNQVTAEAIATNLINNTNQVANGYLEIQGQSISIQVSLTTLSQPPFSWNIVV